MPRISQADILALLDLIGEKGYQTERLEFPGEWYKVKIADKVISIVGKDGEYFVATDRVADFPMESHGHGSIPYRFII